CAGGPGARRTARARPRVPRRAACSLAPQVAVERGHLPAVGRLDTADQLLGDGDRAVLAPGAAHGHREMAAALTEVALHGDPQHPDDRVEVLVGSGLLED